MGSREEGFPHASGARKPANLLTDADHCFTLREPCVASLRSDRHEIGMTDRHHRHPPRLGLKATELATAQAATIREKLFKIGARVTVSVRRVWLSMASSYPRQGLFRQVWANLRG